MLNINNKSKIINIIYIYNFASNSENNKFQIYPNPTKNIIQIKNNSVIEKLTIFDYLGKAILTRTQNNNEINVENLSKGIYIIEIQLENEKVYKMNFTLSNKFLFTVSLFYSNLSNSVKISAMVC